MDALKSLVPWLFNLALALNSRMNISGSLRLNPSKVSYLTVVQAMIQTQDIGVDRTIGTVVD
jgi:hypothetical protein